MWSSAGARPGVWWPHVCRRTLTDACRCSAAPNPLSQIFVDAALAAGHPRTDDFNGADGEGAGWHDLSIADGVRQSTSAAYLRPIRDARPNLTVATGARAHRLLFDADQRTDVEYRQDGAGHTVYADREVILSAGTVDSPRLLLLSGVGPAAADLVRGCGVAGAVS
ncbi:GMC family oxidoreductase N-terminal domain-containing protein [Amycolatopsis sp. NPDC005232]|uniref:GMC family oxidoreductase N-terminal domain-containing protein n=1 Tax=Amycolatopsis sp. NPDC005232 TaxID=3157027 RepID=UPI0033A23424